MPNITGEGGLLRDDYGVSTKGAIKVTRSAIGVGGSGGTTGNLGFDAKNGETKTDGTLKTSSEHRAYGSSDYVTPKNATIKLWKRIN